MLLKKENYQICESYDVKILKKVFMEKAIALKRELENQDLSDQIKDEKKKQNYLP